MKLRSYPHLIKLNTFIIMMIIVCDLFVLPHHNPDIDVSQVSASHRMKLTPHSKLNSMQSTDEREFNSK
ncbi:hypothetical protein [Companilactobacillus nuruki]|uniref:hypothetical protein n=1 Tax=Companilactobacillus nuruki TaxID=1993540 RepID=UPI001054FB0A|nr:hypothetical protein [Companilactobacillus nuruki]